MISLLLVTCIYNDIIIIGYMYLECYHYYWLNVSRMLSLLLVNCIYNDIIIIGYMYLY